MAVERALRVRGEQLKHHAAVFEVATHRQSFSPESSDLPTAVMAADMAAGLAALRVPLFV